MKKIHSAFLAAILLFVPAISFAFSGDFQEIDFPSTVDKTYGDADFELAASASSGLPVSYFTLGPCTVTGSTLHLDGAGSCTVTATQDGDASYAPANEVSRMFTILPKSLIITMGSATKMYGDEMSYVGNEYSVDGLVNSDKVNAVTIESLGDDRSAPVSGSPYAITGRGAVGDGLENYTITYVDGALTVNKRPLVITITVNDKEYDGTTVAHLATTGLGNVNSGDEISIDNATAVFDTPNVGVGKTVTISDIVLSGASVDNYEYSLSGVTASANITPADQVVTLSFAAPKNATYGDSDIDVTGLATSTSGIPPLFSAGGSCIMSSPTVVRIFRGGSVPCAIVAYVRNDNFISGVATNNYINREAKVSFAVARASQTISSTFAAPKNATYGDADIELDGVATSTSGLPITFVTGGACSIVDGHLLHYVRGSAACVLSIRQGGSLQYLPATKVDVSFPVARKAQTITFTLPPSIPLAAGSIVLKGTSDSMLPVSYYISTPTICSASGDQLSLLATGTCKIYARQTGDLRYLPAVQVYGALKVVTK